MNKNIDILALTSGFIPNLGINRGRMGSVVYFCFLSRETNNIEYQKYARTLLEWIISDLNATIPINFADTIKAYGDINWDYPDPRCIDAPNFTNSLT